MDSAVSSATASAPVRAADEKINWLASIPFIGVHLMCLFVLQVGARPRDVLVCLGLYVLRMWGITAGFHRYFSHRSYKAGRGFQFFLALAGTLAVQKGPLWWAAHHRHHHPARGSSMTLTTIEHGELLERLFHDLGRLAASIRLAPPPRSTAPAGCACSCRGRACRPPRPAPRSSA